MFQSLLLVMATMGSRLCGHYIFILWFLLSFFLFIFLRQKLPSAHHRTTLSVYIFATKACIPTIGKQTCPPWSVQPFGHSAPTLQTDKTDKTNRQRTDNIERTVLQTVAQKVSTFGDFWKKKIPCGKIFKILFRELSSRHRFTCCLQISWYLAAREIGEIVGCLPAKKQKFATLSRSRCCANRAQNSGGPAPDNVLRVLQILSKSLQFRWSYNSRTREHRQNAS